MPATFTVRSIRKNNGIRQIHMTRDVAGQSEDILINAVAGSLADIFGSDVREGDMRAVGAPLNARAGTNGKRR